MQSTLTSLRNPKGANAEHTAIDCETTTSQVGEQVLPFTACVDDVEPHGRAIFSDITSGMYGEIAEYVPPPPAPTSTATLPAREIPNSVL